MNLSEEMARLQNILLLVDIIQLSNMFQFSNFLPLVSSQT